MKTNLIINTYFKTLLVLSIALFSVNFVYAQKDTTAQKKLLIGLSISPDMCYRTLQNNDGSSTSAMVIDSRNKNEVPKLAYSAGLSICYNVSSHIGFETGLHYSNKGEKYMNSNLTYGDMIDPRRGFYADGSAPTKVKIIYNYNYLDIPLRAIFTFGNKKVKFISSIGATTNVLINSTQTSVLTYENGDKERNKQKQQYNFNPINVSPSISFGTDYAFSEKLNLRVEPTFRYGLLKIIDAPVTSYLWSAGLNITCYYRIK